MSEVHHRFDGPADAPVLVLSNSLGTTLEMWDEQMPALAQVFRVLRYDTRGHGRSPVPDGPYSIAELGGDVVEMLDREGLARVNFCGVSLGGMTGMWLGINAPERVDRLVLCDTSPYMPPRELWLERSATVRASGTSSLVDATLERWFTPELAKRRPEVVERFRQMLLNSPPEGYASCSEAIADMDLRGELGVIRAPTLVVAGQEDPATGPDHARVMVESIAGAHLEVIPGARHLANVERAEQVNELIVEHCGG